MWMLQLLSVDVCHKADHPPHSLILNIYKLLANLRAVHAALKDFMKRVAVNHRRLDLITKPALSFCYIQRSTSSLATQGHYSSLTILLFIFFGKLLSYLKILLLSFHLIQLKASEYSTHTHTLEAQAFESQNLKPTFAHSTLFFSSFLT
jgi:hypothetical protein